MPSPSVPSNIILPISSGGIKASISILSPASSFKVTGEGALNRVDEICILSSNCMANVTVADESLASVVPPLKLLREVVPEISWLLVAIAS